MGEYSIRVGRGGNGTIIIYFVKSNINPMICIDDSLLYCILIIICVSIGCCILLSIVLCVTCHYVSCKKKNRYDDLVSGL